VSGAAPVVTLLRRIGQILLLLAGVLLFGTAGYMIVEGWSAFDALYMTVITVASVGFGEVHPLSPAGRTFTMLLILVGLGSVAYGLATITAFWVEGHLANLWGKRRMEARIAALRGHTIVCGTGETGRHIARELLRMREPFVCIEVDPAQEAALRRVGDEVLHLIGDATDSQLLRQARVEHARGLIACMPSDKDNLFTLLTARELNPTMRIVSRVVADESRAKLLKAGADVVVSNKTIGALRLVSEMLHPSTMTVMDAMLREPGAVRVHEIPAGPGAVGRTLGALRLQERTGIVVFALREAVTQRYCFNPTPDRVVSAGDILIACADTDQGDLARRLAMEG